MKKIFLFLIGLILLILIGNVYASASIVDYWKFNTCGYSNISNEISGRTNLQYNSASGTPTPTSTGLFDNACGPMPIKNVYTVTTYEVSLDTRNNYSFSFWARKTGERNGRLFHFGDSFSQSTFIHLSIDDSNKLSTGIIVDGNSSASLTNVSWDSDDFTHFVITTNNGYLKLYMDNDLIGTTSQANTGSRTGFIGVGGGRLPTNNLGFNGLIDEFSVWDDTLSENQITLLYNNGNGVELSNTLPTTTFSSAQVSGTTDQNITLTCNSINGCKAINYNINNEGWEQINLNDSGINIYNRDFETNFNLNNPASWTCSENICGLKTGGTTNALYRDNNNPENGSYNLYSHLAWNGSNGFLTITGKTENLSGKTINFSYRCYGTSHDGSVCAKFGYVNDSNTFTSLIDLSVTTNNDNNTQTITIPSGGNYRWATYYASSNSGQPYKTFYLDYINIQTISNNYYSFIYSGTGDHNIQYFSTDNSDNNETTKFSYFPQFQSINEESNSRVKMTGVTTYNGYTVTSWLYTIDGTPLTGTTDRIKYYSTQANEDLNICLTTNSQDTTCKSHLTWDTIDPTIDANIETSTYGFTSTFDINYNMICYDNFTPINYKINWINDGTTTTLYNSDDATETLITNALDLNAGQQATLQFICTDQSGNTATYTSPTIYALQFNLIKELTGETFDLNLVTNAEAFTYDGNYIFNFKDINTDTITFFSPTSVIRFDFTYPDELATKISREIDFAYIEDTNVPVCVAEYQQFYLYRFLSTTEKPIILYNDFADCYSLVSTTKFLYNTYLSNTAYTINKPYYLYTYSNGVKSLLALLDGANNTEINLDILAFNQTDYTYSVETDNLVFRPSDDDSNTIVFYYFSSTDNSQVKLDIYKDNAIIWTYTETTDTNSFQVSFYYADLDVNSDDLLKIVVTKTSEGEETSFYKYFNTKSEVYSGLLNPFVAIVISFFIMFFGITMVAYRYAMGWFGIVISLFAIGILALAPAYDYIIFMQAIYFIVGLFIGVIGKEQTLGIQ